MERRMRTLIYLEHLLYGQTYFCAYAAVLFNYTDIAPPCIYMRTCTYEHTNIFIKKYIAMHIQFNFLWFCCLFLLQWLHNLQVILYPTSDLHFLLHVWHSYLWVTFGYSINAALYVSVHVGVWVCAPACLFFQFASYGSTYILQCIGTIQSILSILVVSQLIKK